LWGALVALLLAGLYRGLKTSLGVREAGGTHFRVFHLSAALANPGTEGPVLKATRQIGLLIIAAARIELTGS